MTRFLKIPLLTLLIIINCITATYSQKGNDSLKIVCIDAGHGGKDPGAIGKISKEKDLCLSIALKAGEYIKNNLPGVEVIYTRETDVFVELGKRPDFANENHADLFISIHINSCEYKGIQGASTYVVGQGRKDDNLNLALTLQENGGEFNKDSIKPLDIITLNTLQYVHKKQSIQFAEILQSILKKNYGRKDRGVKEANFAVLWRAQMPAVLIECGFISNANEEKYMASEDGKVYLASAIYRAVKAYKNEIEKEHVSEPVVTMVESKPQNSTPNVTTKQENKSQNNTKTENNTAKSDSNIYFMVQVKWSKEKIPLSSKIFKGLEVKENFIDNKYIYTVGKTQKMSEITNIQKKTREKISDAFVIAVQNGKRIDVATAKKVLGDK
ncbi:MAG: N-acetylmuramoyl-L-alanine amidase [Bacteroidales bacterium]|nr:N-acetylmuramoyl-L-alanine amidase [Bacteroidales bacterium]